MFMKDAVEIPCPDSAAGLYIRTRTDQIIKVHYHKLEFLAMEGLIYDIFYMIKSSKSISLSLWI